MSGAASKNIRVVVRVRPPNTRELEQNQRTIIKCESQRTLIFDPDEEEDEFFFHGAKQSHRDITRKQNKKLPMEFDEIFDDMSANADVFEAAMKPLVLSVMDGFNCSAFVYGATGAGKTFTMLGSETQPGITYLTMAYLFECMDALSSERKFEIGISYLEVYNEQVMNLLSRTGPLKLREDAGGVVVGGLKLQKINSATELLDLLTLGNQHRTQHPTDANAESSRSHAIFQVHIRMVNLASNQKNTVKLSMIDLAGSERAASTKGIGVRFKEGASINKSLLALGNCINKLADGAKHIPYRDSNLTRIIKDSLGGNCQTVMIANVSPSSLTYEDTYNTLKYASRAKKIRSNVRLNMCKNNTPKDVLVRQLNDQQDELHSLREQVKQLQQRLALAESRGAAAATAASVKTPAITASTTVKTVMMSAADLNATLAPWYERIDDIYRALGHVMESRLRMDSEEKAALFKQEIKMHADAAMNSLALDGNNIKAVSEMQSVLYICVWFLPINQWIGSMFLAQQFRLLDEQQFVRFGQILVAKQLHLQLGTVVFVVRDILVLFQLANDGVLCIFDAITTLDMQLFCILGELFAMFLCDLWHRYENRCSVLLRIQIHAAFLERLQNCRYCLWKRSHIDNDSLWVFANNLGELLQFMFGTVHMDGQRFDRTGC